MYGMGNEPIKQEEDDDNDFVVVAIAIAIAPFFHDAVERKIDVVRPHFNSVINLQ